MNRASRTLITTGLAILTAVATWSAAGQNAVVVRARLDTNVIAVGQSTTLRIYGQVAPHLEADANRILTWYVDVLNADGSVASANYEAMVKTSSDNDPLISGAGVDEGDDRRGVYDTFLNLAGAGVGSEVELLAVPVMGVGTGLTEFSAGPGSGVTNLSSDFIVAPADGGQPWLGGDYGSAIAVLEVTGDCAIALRISRGMGGGGPGQPLELSFDPCPGYNHTVEFSGEVGPGASWTALPGGPHNSGSLTTTNSASPRFFRVRAQTGMQGCDLRLSIERGGGGSGQSVNLLFDPCPGYDHTVEFSDAVDPDATWAPLSGAPHNSGLVTVTNMAAPRFFRVRADSQ